MSNKTILSINYGVPCEEDEYVEFSSDRSLLDADIILISLERLTENSGDYYQGRILVDEEESPSLIEQAEHWRQELVTALERGLTVFVIFKQPVEYAVHVGNRYDSHTHESSPVISGILGEDDSDNTLGALNSYSILPVELGEVVSRSGSKIIPAGELGIFATYWKRFSKYSSYEAYLNSRGDATPLLKTKTGEKIVGAVFKYGEGHVVLLPPLGWSDDSELYTFNAAKTGMEWTSKAEIVGKQFLSTLIDIDKQLRAKSMSTPPPEWAQEREFRLPKEDEVQTQLDSVQGQIKQLVDDQERLREVLAEAQKPKRLLFEKGPQLEDAVVDGLQTLGFTATNHREGDSEFDVVFESEEGRCLGEVEGKDDKAVSIEKLRQLEMNIQEDFSRDEVTEYAKPVLFGNGFRLKAPGEREAEFTQKCLTGARRSKVALVRTSDLFRVVAYLKEHPDPDFSKACREAIFNTAGEVVSFPIAPDPAEMSAESVAVGSGGKKSER
jgi:hypothetical protein